MKNKNEVYVSVDTPKKAKKLKKVLDMFGEKIEDLTRLDLKKYKSYWINREDEIPVVFFYESENEWIGAFEKHARKKFEVSIKELRTILAKEHLKVGDVVLTVNDTLVKISEIFSCDKFIGFGKNNTIVFCYFDSFKRYATPEEIELLEGKKDKFAELKEAHKNGAVIQMYYRLPYHEFSTWNDVKDEDGYILWNTAIKHRIKPEEKPKVGDVIAVYNQDEFKCIEVFSEYHKHQNFDYITYKTLTQQEAIDLLWKK